MTTDRDFKRLVRGRMQKTGESYTAARTILLRRPPPTRSNGTAPPLPSPAPARPAARPDPASYAKLAGMSDSAIKAKTGCDWAKWVAALDYKKAHEWSHREIAEYVHDKFKVPDWWTQTVTVGYERIKGLREIGQRRDGGFEATRSKTVAVPVGKLYRAFTDARLRNKWLPCVKPVLRKGTPNKSVRMTWEDGTSVEVWLTAKGQAKSQAGLAHRKLADKEDAARRKAYWSERLDALAEMLTQ
jgi:hypothetical protein